MSRRLRILYVAPYPPSPLAVRPLLLIGELAKRQDIDVLTLAGPSSLRAPVGRLIGSYASSPLDRLGSIVRLANPGYPLQVLAVASGSMRRAVARALVSDTYDLVHLEHVRAIQFLPESVSVPIIFDAVDCVSELFAQASRHYRGLKRALFWSESRRLARYERSALAGVSRVLVTSDRDRRSLARHTGLANIVVVPNAVDLRRFVPSREPRQATVVFTGKMSFHANAHAARWLCREIWPLVRARHPEARLLIAGASPGNALRRRQRTDIEVTGYVASLEGIIGSAAVAVAPLAYAVGTQNKVLEAMACATPVVATPAAVGDLALSDGREALIGRDASELANRINSVLEGPAYGRAIGEAGRRYVERHHAVAHLADLVEDEYRDLVPGFQRRPDRSAEAAAAD